MPSIKDVAQRAGVAISTVSHVINGTKAVSKPTVQKVRAAIEELDYQVDSVARSMKSNKTNRIGLVVSDICGLFFPYITHAIYNIAEKSGYSLTIYDTHCSIEQEKRSIRELVRGRVDGLIFSSVISEPESKNYIQELLELTSQENVGKNLPIVSMERNFSMYGVDSICTDMKLGAYKAMRHLIKMGCRNIAYIAEPFSFGGRTVAYQETLQENNLPVDKKLMREGNFTHISGYRCMNEILEEGIPVDGVFAANDQMALGACLAIKEHGLQIPKDIKIIGFDDVFVASIMTPPLSTVRIEKNMLGIEAIKTLLFRLGQTPDPSPYGPFNSSTRCIHLENHLIVRQSTDLSQPDLAAFSLTDW